MAKVGINANAFEIYHIIENTIHYDNREFILTSREFATQWIVENAI